MEKENDKRIFNHYKNKLADGGKTRFNIIQYLCSFPKINPHEMAAALIAEGCEIAFDDSSISKTENEVHKRTVDKELRNHRLNREGGQMDALY